jgi:hypothetical protein
MVAIKKYITSVNENVSYNMALSNIVSDYLKCSNNDKNKAIEIYINDQNFTNKYNNEIEILNKTLNKKKITKIMSKVNFLEEIDNLKNDIYNFKKNIEHLNSKLVYVKNEIIDKNNSDIIKYIYEIDKLKKLLDISNVENSKYKNLLEKQNIINTSCVICFEKIEQYYVSVPCGHKNLCLDCKKNLNLCPICKSKINMFIKLY